MLDVISFLSYFIDNILPAYSLRIMKDAQILQISYVNKWRVKEKSTTRTFHGILKSESH